MVHDSASASDAAGASEGGAATGGAVAVGSASSSRRRFLLSASGLQPPPSLVEMHPEHSSDVTKRAATPAMCEVNAAASGNESSVERRSALQKHLFFRGTAIATSLLRHLRI